MSDQFLKVKKIVDKIKVAMLTTQDEKSNQLNSRPMHTAGIEVAGYIYFFTSVVQSGIAILGLLFLTALFLIYNESRIALIRAV